MRILVADDDPKMLAAVCEILVESGFEVSEATDGVAALRAFRSQPTDLVLGDVFMPNKDGLETISELKSQSPSVKIIVMSGGGSVWTSGLLETAKQLGASAVLHKPFTASELRRALRQALGGV